jgi:hypothetical protein
MRDFEDCSIGPLPRRRGYYVKNKILLKKQEYFSQSRKGRQENL